MSLFQTYIAFLYYAAAANNTHLSSPSCHVTIVGGLLGSILAVSLLINVVLVMALVLKNWSK